MAVSTDIAQKASDIRTKVYGKDVRESLASGLETMSSDINQFKEDVNTDNENFKTYITAEETQHAQAESARVTAENGRVNAENSRVTAENGRVAAETARETAFSQMQHVDANAELAAARQGKSTLLENLQSKDSQLADNTNQLSNNVQQNKGKFNLKYIERADLIHNKLHRISVIGDSISHGAGSLDSPNNSWTGILRKMLQVEYNTTNYGYVNFGLPEATHGVFDNDAISIIRTGSWIEKNPDGSYIGGYATESSTTGDLLNITVKKASKFIALWYEIASDGGIITVAVNGNSLGTIDTSIGTSAKYGLTDAFDVSTYTTPYTLTITKNDSKRTALCGVEIFDDLTQNIFDNYSKSGLALADVTSDILTMEADSDVVFFALGYNDKYGRYNLPAFTNGITTLINALNSNNALCIVLDFLWYENSTDAFRQQLARINKEVANSIYIPFPDLIRFKNSTDAINFGFLVDGTHLTPRGHQMIAEYIAKTIGLGVTSKKLVEKIQMQSQNFSDITLQNGWQKRGGNCGIVKNGNTISIFFSLKSGTMTNGTTLFNIPVWAIPGGSGVVEFPVVVSTDSSNSSGVCYINSGGCKIGGGVTSNAGLIGNISYNI